MDAEKLSKFSPFNAFKATNLDELLKDIEIKDAAQGEVLFNQGDSDKRTIYLLSGTVSLQDGDNVLGTISGGTDDALHPIAPGQPRPLSALAMEGVKYFFIDSELLDVKLTLDQTGVYEVCDLSTELPGEEGDWMSALLRAKIFEQIPPQSIQMIFMRLNRVDFKAGHEVIKQGTKGDDFFIIRSGRCRVTRETPGNGNNIALAELGVGDTFGEEALLSEDVRNATVTMHTDGILMRLGRKDFQELLNEPMIVSLEPDVADEAISQGGQWLDVRVPSEFNTNRKENATNLPLYMLRHKLNVLDRNTPYIVYCDTGRRSSAAAFILSQLGFETAVLKGGLNQIAA